jgi:hypothetical protein
VASGHRYHKIENYGILFLNFEKFGLICEELEKFLPQKFSVSSQKYRVGIRDPEKTSFGSGVKRPRIRIRSIANTAKVVLMPN